MRGIDGWFSEDEGRWYARFARALRGGTLVEVGSWKGRSASFAGPVCNANGTRFVCVDHWGGSRDTLSDRYVEALAREDVEAIFRANMAILGITVEVVAEPFLVRRGLLARTPRGRVATAAGWAHLGLEPPPSLAELPSLFD